MKKRNLILLSIFIIAIAVIYVLPRFTKYHLPVVIHSSKQEKDEELENLKLHSLQIKNYCTSHNYSTKYCFFIDMKLESGKNRFFVYDLKKDSIIAAGLVAHGSCNKTYLQNAKFSNEVGCGCSAFGKYKVGYKYKGRFGNAYKLFGLDTSNNNAFDRSIVLHAYSCVPDEETYPQPICNSLGCTMVSYKFLEKLSGFINQSSKPILLWMFN